MLAIRDPGKATQVGFLLLLVVCVAQAAWWIADQARLANGERDRIAALYQAEAQALSSLLSALPADGDAQDLLTAALPHLTYKDGAIRVREAATSLLADRASSRINQYAWEGGFFVLVLLAGMAVLTRAIALDRQLRRRQQDFLASVSHEFKSPLASMRLSAETLVLRAKDPGSRHLGQRLLEDGERLLRMVDNLLSAAQVEAGRLSLTTESVSVAAAVSAAVADYEALAAAHDIVLSSDVATDLQVRADRLALETVLRNLLDNAVKACLSGNGSQVSVHGEAASDGRKVRIRVRDDGIGFPANEAARIFGKFYKSPARSSPGNGLGLYLVRRLTEISGARAEGVSAGVGHGAEFEVCWPAAVAP